MLGNIFDLSGWYPGNHRISGNISSDYGASRDHRIVPDSHPRQNHGVGPDPHIFAKHNGGRKVVPAMFRNKIVIDRSQNHIVPNQRPVANGNASLILKAAPGIDKHVFPIFRFLPQSV